MQVSASLFFSYWEKLKIDNFEKMDKDIHSLLRFGVMRAQKPIIITGGPFYNLNLVCNLVYFLYIGFSLALK